ncbi:MAG: tRNA (N(6)-L-threonylcarbamoyladenosine(37)-C(2))-methylthiotransferase [Candidatus Bathyarchaeia archaeon]
MRVFVKSFGCSLNLADGEVLAGCLAEVGYELVNSPLDADVIIYNTCAVKGPTENRMIEILKRVPNDKRLVVAGCLPLINFERLSREVRFDGVVGPAFGKEIIEVVRRVLGGEKVVILENALVSKPCLDLPRKPLNPVVSIIPVNYGCLGSCAYCCVVFARGRLRSYGIDEIVERVKRDLALGFREFWITSQDVACYGRDLGTNLAELLRAICAIEGDFKVRVGMMTPNMAIDILDDLIEAFKDNKIFKFLHLPVQSGDNQVLQRMRRFYSVEDFKKIVEAFRKRITEITIATDIICGFPGETEEAFKRTLQLIEEVKPDIVNVSKFFTRPGTAAASMKNDFVPLNEIKRRSSLAASLARRIAFERNKRWVGWVGEIIVDEAGKVSGSWVGRNFAYKPIVIKSGGINMLGKTLRVKVVEAFGTHLLGVVC